MELVETSMPWGKIIITTLLLAGLAGVWIYRSGTTLGAQPALTAFQGGTGTSSPSGILYGDSTIRLKTVSIGSNLTFSGGTLSANNQVTGGTAGMLTSWTSATALTATGTPTFAAFVSTSTATSTMAGGLSLTRFNISATSTGSKGIDITAGCFAVNGSCIGAGVPGGSNTQIQFNDSGSFGGDSGLTWNKNTGVLRTGVAGSPMFASGEINLADDFTASIEAFPGVNGSSIDLNFQGAGIEFYTGVDHHTAPIIDLSYAVQSQTINIPNGSGTFLLSSTTASGLYQNFQTERLGFGTSTPFAKFAIHAISTINNNDKWLFAIASSSQSATTTFLSIDNTGKLFLSRGANATTTASIGELNLNTSKGCVNINTSAGGAASFYINAAGTMVVETNYCR